MKRQLAAVLITATLALSGCASFTGLSANAELFTVCFSYDRTLSVLNTFRDGMTDATIGRVKETVKILSPICKTGATTDLSLTTLQIVRDGLAKLVKIQRESAI